MKNFIIRALTGIIYVAMLAGCTVYSPVTAFFFFAIVAAACVGEFCQLANRHAGASVVVSLNVLAAFLLVASVWLYCIGSPSTGHSLALYALLVIYLLAEALYIIFHARFTGRRPGETRFICRKERIELHPLDLCFP